MIASNYKRLQNKSYRGRDLKKKKSTPRKSRAISGYKAVFVDFDGTLIDSLPALFECYCEFLRKHSIEGTREEFNTLIGPTIPEVAAYLKEKYQLKQNLSELIPEYHELVAKAYMEDAKIISSVLAMTKKLKSRGLKTAIVTSAPYDLVESFLEKRGLRNIFHVIIACMPGEPSKPDPAVYLRALDTLRVAPEETIVIEDAVTGIQSAKAAGIEFVIQNVI